MHLDQNLLEFNSISKVCQIPGFFSCQLVFFGWTCQASDFARFSTPKCLQVVLHCYTRGCYDEVCASTRWCSTASCGKGDQRRSPLNGAKTERAMIKYSGRKLFESRKWKLSSGNMTFTQSASMSTSLALLKLEKLCRVVKKKLGVY